MILSNCDTWAGIFLIFCVMMKQEVLRKHSSAAAWIVMVDSRKNVVELFELQTELGLFSWDTTFT